MVSDSIEEKDILERALLFVIDVLARNKLKLILSLLVGGVLGFSVSYLKTPKFTSQATLLPEANASGGVSLGSLASLAGIETGGSGETDAIRPEVYPNILKSPSALIYLLNQPVQTDSGKSYQTLLAYFETTKKLKVSPSFLKLNAEDTIYKYKPAELAVIGALKVAITSEVDKKGGIVDMSVEMPDARVAAIILFNSIKYLKEYVTDYRYGKKHEQKGFVNSQLSVARERMTKARNSLQNFRDSNRNLFMNQAKIQEDKLAEEYGVAQGVYNSLLRQSETLNITEKQVKPVFEILEPPMIPNGRSSPNRIFYGIGGSFLTFLVLAIGLIIINNRNPKVA